MANILVCDDDREIVDAIEIYLLQEGYTIFKAYDGQEAVRILKEQQIHLLLIDIMMPKMDGIHATIKIREYSSVPIIFLSAKSEDNDKILGLNIGADDYITKPFNPQELVARVKSNLRRYTMLGNLNTENNALFQVGGLCINDDTKEVTVDGEVIDDVYGKEVIENPGRAYEPIELGKDEYFVLGDNRNDSTDSREPNVGNIRRENIIGRAWLRIWPLEKFGFIKHR